MTVITKTQINSPYLNLLCDRQPFARADICGCLKYPDINGTSEFYATPMGVLVITEVSGLPSGDRAWNECQIFGFYINEDVENSKCFQKLSRISSIFPPLFCQGGYAWSSHITDGLYISELIGKTLIIDDSAGEQIAFGTVCSTK